MKGELFRGCMMTAQKRKLSFHWIRRTYLARVCFGLWMSGLLVLAVMPVQAAPFAYISHYRSNSVSVIDTATNTVTATVTGVITAGSVAVHPDGTRVYVANGGSDNVSVIDTATNTVIATVPVGDGPGAFGQFIGPPPPVNSTGDAVDSNLTDGVCYTGAKILRDPDLEVFETECTLRAAIEQANENPVGQETITFNIPTNDPGFNPTDGTFTITPASPLPDILDPLILDATTQPSGKVVLDGNRAGAEANGLHITAGDLTVKGLTIKRFGKNGIFSEGGGIEAENLEVVGNGDKEKKKGNGIESEVPINARNLVVSDNGLGGILGFDHIKVENVKVLRNGGDGINSAKGDVTIDQLTVNDFNEVLANDGVGGGDIVAGGNLNLDPQKVIYGEACEPLPPPPPPPAGG
ncbi:MAG: hypothetical protein HYZ72_03480 [Deltaproteobacteria bacterium]|nr:hypothetical protein [Deltaproteobacteria bacterium]